MFRRGNIAPSSVKKKTATIDRAGNGQREAITVRPGESYQPYEVFHVDRDRPEKDPMSVLAFSEPSMRSDHRGRISTTIGGNRQSEFNPQVNWPTGLPSYVRQSHLAFFMIEIMIVPGSWP